MIIITVINMATTTKKPNLAPMILFTWACRMNAIYAPNFGSPSR